MPAPADARDRWIVGHVRAKPPGCAPPVLFDTERPSLFPFVDKIHFLPTPEALKIGLYVSLLLDGDGQGWLVSNKILQGSFSKYHLAIDVRTGANMGAKTAHCDPLLGRKNLQITPPENVRREAEDIHQFSPATPVYGIFENRLKPKVYTLLANMDGDLWELACAAGTAPVADRRALGRIAMQALSRALGDLHRRGYVHGDVKLENSLFSSEMGIILSDFGTLSPIQADGTVPANAHNTTYPAPEELLGPTSSSAKDMWGLGVLLLSLYAGNNGNEMFANAKGPKGLHANLNAFAAWRQAVLTRDKSSLTEATRRATREMELEFEYFYGHDKWVAHFMLTRLMHPNPAQRATADEAATFIDELLQRDPGAKPRAHSLMHELAAKSENPAKFALMRTYLPAARAAMRAGALGGLALAGLSSAA